MNTEISNKKITSDIEAVAALKITRWAKKVVNKLKFYNDFFNSINNNNDDDYGDEDDYIDQMMDDEFFECEAHARAWGTIQGYFDMLGTYHKV